MRISPVEEVLRPAEEEKEETEEEEEKEEEEEEEKTYSSMFTRISAGRWRICGCCNTDALLAGSIICSSQDMINQGYREEE